MKPPKRTVRAVAVVSIADKKYTKVGKHRKTIDLVRMRVHPLMVVADLRRGCLKSLHRYLGQESGIPDAAVALALQKLIAGSPAEAKFQLAVIEHPDRPSAKGGHPLKTTLTPTQKQLDSVEKLEALLSHNVATEAAVAQVVEDAKKLAEVDGDEKKRGTSTIYDDWRVVKKFRKMLEAEEARLQQEKNDAQKMNERRIAALETLRAERANPGTD